MNASLDRWEGKPRRRFRGGDIRETVLFALAALGVRVLPTSAWGKISDGFAGLSPRVHRRAEQVRRGVCAVLGDEFGDRAGEIYLETRRHFERRRVYVSALSGRERWAPAIELNGLEEILSRRDRGAILWFDHFVHFPVVGKMALAQAGHLVPYLGSRLHGFSISAYGVRYLNPRQINVERRYIRERITVDAGSPMTATRKMVEILDNRGMVGLTNSASIGRAAFAPFGKRGRLAVATTPLRLAAAGKANVFPVSVLESEPFTAYRVTVRPPLSATAGKDPVAAMLSEYTDYLLPLVRAHPDQWASWRSLGFCSDEAPSR